MFSKKTPFNFIPSLHILSKYLPRPVYLVTSSLRVQFLISFIVAKCFRKGFFELKVGVSYLTPALGMAGRELPRYLCVGKLSASHFQARSHKKDDGAGLCQNG